MRVDLLVIQSSLEIFKSCQEYVPKLKSYMNACLTHEQNDIVDRSPEVPFVEKLDGHMCDLGHKELEIYEDLGIVDEVPANRKQNVVSIVLFAVAVVVNKLVSRLAEIDRSID